jgi:acylphosphatase
MLVTKKVIYRGHVQGVGFRYTTQHIAAGFAVAGYVRNLSSGDVELIVEGEEDQVDAILKRIGQVMAGHIREAHVTTEPSGGYKDFRLRH